MRRTTLVDAYDPPLQRPTFPTDARKWPDDFDRLASLDLIGTEDGKYRISPH